MQALNFHFLYFLDFRKRKLFYLNTAKILNIKKPTICSKLYVTLLLHAYYLHITFTSSKILINSKVDLLNMKTRSEGYRKGKNKSQTKYEGKHLK